MIMQQTSKNVIKLIRTLWPGLQLAWVPDTEYVIPSIADVQASIESSGINKLRFNGELMDCDDYALQLHAWIKMDRILHAPQEEFHWAFGEAFGNMFRRVEEIHTLNICVAIEGVYLIEPQTYDIWKADPKEDNVFTIKM